MLRREYMKGETVTLLMAPQKNTLSVYESQDRNEFNNNDDNDVFTAMVMLRTINTITTK